MRPEKSGIVADLAERLNASPYLIIVDYTGMTVGHFGELRNRLAQNGAECHVVKNTMLRHAIEELKLPELNGVLRGQNAVVSGSSDVCGAAKILKTFKTEFDRPEIRAGILDKALLSVEQILELASLPSKDVLQAQLLGLLMSPATKLVRVLNEPAASLARVLKAKADKENS